jgi:hypothetical protein
MKLVQFGIIIAISIFWMGRVAWADSVTFATDEDIRSFDKSIKVEQNTRSGQQRVAPTDRGAVGRTAREEAKRLTTEGARARDSQFGKWVTEQKQGAKKVDDAGGEVKKNQDIRGRSGSRRSQ